MTTAVCSLFFAPIGIASGGGHGSSVSTFGTPASWEAAGEGDRAGCFEAAGFSFGVSIIGGLADPYVNVPGVKSSAAGNDGIVPSQTTKLPFGSLP